MNVWISCQAMINFMLRLPRVSCRSGCCITTMQERNIFFKKNSFVSYTWTNNKRNDTKHFYGNISFFFTSVYNHPGGDALVQRCVSLTRWSRLEKEVQTEATFSPPHGWPRTVWMLDCLFHEKKNSSVKVSDKSSLFPETLTTDESFQCLLVNVVVTFTFRLWGFFFWQDLVEKLAQACIFVCWCIR